MPQVEFAGIVDKQFPGGGFLILGRAGTGVEESQEIRNVGIAGQPGGFAAGRELLGPGCFNRRGGSRGGRFG